MPIYKTLSIDQQTTVLIWKIEESLQELEKNITLSPYCASRYLLMKSEMHKKGFMSIRHLLAEFGYTDSDLIYDEKGKPHLKDDKEISITHSFEFTAIIVSDKRVGIDIEKQREKIKIIAPKFTPVEEYNALGPKDLIKKLTIVWGAKEALYKLYGKKGLRFYEDIFVHDFNFSAGTTNAEVNHHGNKTHYTLNFLDFEGFICVYAIALS